MAKLYYKLMWLPNTKHTIWEMKTEKVAKFSEQKYFTSLINQNIDLNDWIADYSNYYKKWLDNDDETIFDFNSSLLKSILDAIKKVNKKLDKDKHLFYWYDIDRSFNEDYNWIECPITKKKLINLGNNFFYTNRFISEKADLVLPDKE